MPIVQVHPPLCRLTKCNLATRLRASSMELSVKTQGTIHGRPKPSLVGFVTF